MERELGREEKEWGCESGGSKKNDLYQVTFEPDGLSEV